jgi:hypothetical protein
LLERDEGGQACPLLFCQVQGLYPYYTSRSVKSFLSFSSSFVLRRFLLLSSRPDDDAFLSRSSSFPSIPGTVKTSGGRKVIQLWIVQLVEFSSFLFLFSSQFSGNVDTNLCLSFRRGYCYSPSPSLSNNRGLLKSRHRWLLHQGIVRGLPKGGSEGTSPTFSSSPVMY